MTVTLVRPARPELAGFGAVTLVRVRPAPAIDPPYDDEPAPLRLEPHPERRGTGGTGEPASAEPAVSPGPAASGGPAVSLEPAASGGPAVSAEASRVVRRYLELCLEVLGGYRPLAHLRPRTEPARFDEVTAQLGRLGRSALTRPGSGPDRVGADRFRLRRLRVCEVRAGVVEAAAVLARGEQVRAVTLRLEQHDGGWLCTHLEVL